MSHTHMATARHCGVYRMANVMIPVITLFVVAFCHSVVGSPLDTKIAAFDNADRQTAGAVADILKTGLGENRSAEAYASLKPWLTDNATDSQAVLFYAGRTAEYAGEWNDAASYYRKLLQKESLNAKRAADVVPAIYRLMINNLRDENAAYLFMREEGNRLRQYGRASQFDPWFLRKALKKNDIRAVADRLAIIHGDANENVSDYDRFLEQLNAKLQTFDKQDEPTVDALNQFASVVREKGFKERWNWIHAVTLYNEKAREIDIKREKPEEDLLDEPLKAAGALLAIQPVEGAALIAKGWSRWNQGDTPTFFRFVHAHKEQKGQVFVDALQNLSVDVAKEMLKTGDQGPRGRWVSVAGFITAKQAQTVMARFPSLLNAIDAPDVSLWYKEITIEEAKAMAPRLSKNPTYDAALVRAFASTGEKAMNPMLETMAASESWRFAGGDKQSPARRMVDTLWNSGLDRNGFDHGANVKKYEKLWGEGDHGAFAKQVSKDANSKTRLSAFAKIYNELQSTPSTPRLLDLWNDVLAQAPDPDRIVMLKKLVTDFIKATGEATDLQKHLLARAIRIMEFGNAYSQFTFGPAYDGGWDRWGHDNMRKRLGDFEVFARAILGKQMQAGTMSPELFAMWLHCVDPKEDASKNFFKKLIKSPAYQKLGEDYHKMASFHLVFGDMAIIEKSENDASTVSRELLALSENATPAQVEAAFKTVMMRVSKASEPVDVIGMQKVAALPSLTGATRKLALILFNQFSPLGDYPSNQGYEELVIRLAEDMQKKKAWGEIEPYAADFWRSAGSPDDGRRYPAAERLAKFAESALEANEASIALSVARCGMASRISALDANNNQDDAPGRRNRMRAVSGKASEILGVSEIPVDATHPDYGIYTSHSEYVQGNEESAWELYKQNRSVLFPEEPDPDHTSLLRKLPPGYSFWLLERSIEEGMTDEAENLVKELMIWSRASEGAFSLEQRGLLMIVYADLAFLKGALPTARAWYRKVADSREYKGSSIYVRAALGSVKVDRVSKNFSSALEELDRLLRMGGLGARPRIHYARAEVFMDQENYKNALDEVTAVLREEPNHPDALILRGKVHFQMRKLVEATEIELGVSQEDNVIVPGETLKINLLDPSLSVSGVGVDIEVEVITRSGDRERLMLYQLGDSKDKFRAEVPTELGPAVPGDKTLQVLGKDAIRYGYSKRFRAKMKDLPPDPDVIITVASDAHLSLSAGAFAAREGERKLDVEELGLSTAQAALGTRAVRPGNPIYIRVMDADQSKTSGIDAIPVSVRASSGDEIRKVTLKETSPYSGVFEGVIPTAGAQAMAFASENAPGRDPNLAISPNQTAGWQGELGDKDKTRTFGVDLNDNVALDNMRLMWGEGDVGLTHFVLQTSMNGRDWITRSRYPDNPAPWDGRPRVRSFPTYGRDAMNVSEPTSYALPSDWSEKMELSTAKPSLSYAAEHVKSIASMKPDLASGGHPGYSVVMQYRALFYQPDAAIRRFRLTGYPAEKTIFLLDGEPAPEDSEDPLFIERELRPGLHEIQIWRHEGRNDLEKRTPVLLCDVPGQAELMACPDGMFDPSSFPSGIRSKIAKPARIETIEKRGIDVSFGENTQARLFRLVIQGFKGVAPVVQSVRLADRRGKTHLPVAQDTMKLRQNMQLEVLPGDRISVQYDDPVSATPKRTRHEKNLQVAFNDASISVSFVEFEMLADGDRKLLLEPIRRFKHGDAVLFVVEDADMDGSADRDQIEFHVTTSDGLETKQKAIETEPHSGVFIGRIFPVEGKPSRASEIQIAEGGTLTATYRDTENLDPGIPTDRQVTIEHARYIAPQLGVYAMDSEPIPVEPVEGKPEEQQKTRGRVQEVFPARESVRYHYVAPGSVNTAPLEGIIGCSLRFDVVAPHLALSQKSTLHAYVQVVTNGVPATGTPIDITRPGTLKLEATPTGRAASAAPGYKIGLPPVPPTNKPPLDEGRFAFSVPLMLGMTPERSFATRDAASLPSNLVPEGLAVKGGDVVLVGYAWKDPNDKVQWRTAAVKVVSHAFLNVMNEDYSETLASAFVGEKVFVRLLAYGLDRGPERERTSVMLRASTTGAQAEFSLRETEPHSGIFKGVFPLSYAAAELPDELPPVALNGLPVRYGDEVTIAYPGQELKVTVNMGADGAIEPFSKRFTGDEMAVETSFTLAECFFELAKKHRKMGQESLSRREMAHAQKLLSEAVATHQDNALRAHAEYLLGNLAQEYAGLSKNDAAKLPMYQEALARFSKIPVDYPETEWASKSQFKTALVYEKMGEMDIAVEEYVKLAYKYPDSEHIPEVMSRLGGYFQKKGQTFKDQADPLREETDVESQGEVLRLDELSYPEFLRAARIFAQLQERFPDDPLAGLAGLRAAQNYMRAHQYDDAMAGFEQVYETEDYDGRDIRAQAMYWNGLCHERKMGLMSEDNWRGRGEATRAAYTLYRRVTYDFPDSKWAKFARGRLADPVFSRIIEKETKARERMLEGLKEQRKNMR